MSMQLSLAGCWNIITALKGPRASHLAISYVVCQSPVHYHQLVVAQLLLLVPPAMRKSLPCWNSRDVSWGAPRSSSSLSLSAERTQQEAKWFIRIGWLWGFQVGEQGSATHWNSVGYSFIIKGKIGRRKRPPSSSFSSRHQASIISSSSTSGRGVFLSLHGQARTIMVQWKWAKSW